jgi:endonuclease/exonuclease/phosphatase family metal-dependent hydrolase
MRLAMTTATIRIAAICSLAPLLAASPGTGLDADLTPRALANVDAAPLSVLSFNMQHRDRPGELAVLADRLEADLARLPDFILCQEVVFDRATRKGAEDTATVLAEEMGYYCHGIRRTSDKEGVAILSRYPFLYWTQLDLKARTNGLLLGFQRVSAMGEFEVPEIGRVRVVNVHLAHWPFEGHIRRKQLTETLEWVARREREVPADVTILGGDFNIEPGWGEMEVVTASQDVDAFEFQDFNGTEPTRGAKGNPSSRVDYIFVSAEQRPVAFLEERVLYRNGFEPEPGRRRIYPSDHLPLLHEYTIGARDRIAGAR